MNPIKPDREWARVQAPGFAVLAVGVSCMMTQLALMRELLAAFWGNELMLALGLGFWLLLMGVGASLGRATERLRKPVTVLGVVQVWLALMPPAQIFAARALRDVVFTRGAEVGVMGAAWSCAVLLLPYCVPAGFALALGCAVLAGARGTTGVGTGYALDSVGMIVGGALFLVLVQWFDHIELLAFPTALNLGSAAWLFACAGPRRISVAVAVLGTAMVVLLGTADLDGVSTRWQLPGERVLARANSPYGRLVVSQNAGQINFLENGVAVTTTRDDQHVEETVHYALSQRPRAARVLLVSGGISGTALEALRYGAARLDYVELDPTLLELGQRFAPHKLADARLHLIRGDARLYLRANRAAFDVIIVDLPPPGTVQLNRFYTAEFFTEAKRALKTGGVVSFGLGRYENYISPELGRLLACTRRTLASVFRNTLLVPGGRVYFLASDDPLDGDIVTRIEACGLKNHLVNRHYLEGMLTPDRLAQVNQASNAPAPVNYDLAPLLYFLQTRHWLSQFSFRAGWVALLAALALLAYVARLRRSALVLFASGFTGSSLNLVLLLGFQVFCGSVYHQVALIVTAFMAGLAAGAWLANRPSRVPVPTAATTATASFSFGFRISRFGFLRAGPLTKSRNGLAPLALALTAYSLALPFVLRAMSWLAGSPAALLVLKAAVCLLAVLLGTAIGAQFPLANRLEGGSRAPVLARLFTADFIGAFAGALLAGTVLLPVIGLLGVCLVTAVLNALAALAVGRTRSLVP